jgi:hypothetical protein
MMYRCTVSVNARCPVACVRGVSAGAYAGIDLGSTLVKGEIFASEGEGATFAWSA